MKFRLNSVSRDMFCVNEDNVTEPPVLTQLKHSQSGWAAGV